MELQDFSFRVYKLKSHNFIMTTPLLHVLQNILHYCMYLRTNCTYLSPYWISTDTHWPDKISKPDDIHLLHCIYFIELHSWHLFHYFPFITWHWLHLFHYIAFILFINLYALHSIHYNAFIRINSLHYNLLI